MERPVENARSLFDYDAGEPPGVRATSIDVTIRDLTYQAAPKRWVRAYLVAPNPNQSQLAGLLFLHPGPGSRATFLAEAVTLAGMGAVSLLVDAPWANDGVAAWGRAVTDPVEAVREHVRTVIDLRRGLDLLIAQPDVDPGRIGFVGHSFGALIGAVLAGVDRRLAAAVLMAGTGRFADVAAVNLPDLQGERLEHYRRALAEIDPAAWIGRAAPTPLFFQAALRDEFFTEEQTREFFEQASEPKSLEWYDAGHFLDEAARRDRIAWLAGWLSLGWREPSGSR
jgi:dienelactone hydrolase